MSVYARLHRDDKEMVEIYSIRGGRRGGAAKEWVVIWGVIHTNAISEMSDGIYEDLREGLEIEITGNVVQRVRV